MNKIKLGSALLLLILAQSTFAQSAKKTPPPAGRTFSPEQLRLKAPARPAVPTAADPFGVGEASFLTLPAFVKAAPGETTLKIVRGENGLPILIKGKTAASASSAGENKTPGERALDYLVSLRPEAIAEPGNEFRALRSETDDLGLTHVRLEQMFKGIPVFGGEVVAHARAGVFEMLNGRYFPTPKLTVLAPNLTAQQAFEKTVEQLGGPTKVKLDWTAQELKLVGGQNFEAELVIYHLNEQTEGERLAWFVTMHPNLMHRYQFFVDAMSGEILNKINFTCKIFPEHGDERSTANGERFLQDCGHLHQNSNENGSAALVAGPVTGQGQDLFNVNRSFGAWQEGSVVYMEDASKPMFNAAASQMPNDPVGAIVTLDAFNTSPEVQSSFNYDVVVSNSTTFGNKAAVSAHWNSIKSYDYFKNTFNRNGIDGAGGNIAAFVNVAESDLSSMENAFWNGDAMWYGNGGSFFKPLARGLDVGGHEMTHGVVEKTANLIYENESGALNESFADIFGAMIDRDDWKIGEDVMQSGVSPGNCLRSLEDPHNNDTQGSNWWQPRHMNEKYNGSQDNGGVHINSGIVNHAFYRFASNAAVGKDKAEQVYYKALKDYLVKSSKFIDSRLAVIQAATELYGSAVANAAAAAFDAVGIIGSQPGGNYLGTLQPNPGQDLILCTTDDYENLDIANGNGAVAGAIFTEGLKSRPSVSDNGSQVVFVSAEGHIILIDLAYNGGQVTPTVQPLSDQPVWRNTAISKDGRFLAALTDNQDNRVYVFDLADPTLASQTFFLYNPTYTQGQSTNDVKYADVLDFDYSGRRLMYDAYTEVTNSQGEDLSYWDIGFLKFWENNSFTDGEEDIAKLFNGLPEKTSVGNPTFAKNSPFVIAFDVIDGQNNQYDIYGANTETGDFGPIVQDNGDLGWPNYNRLDNKLLYETEPLFFGKDLYLQGLASSKIAPSGNASSFIGGHVWGVWFANGNRNLQVSADEPNATLALQAAPNPVDDVLRVELASKTAANGQIVVFDLLGRAVRSQQVQVAEGQNRFEVPMLGLASGNYLVRLQAGQAIATLKIVKN